MKSKNSLLSSLLSLLLAFAAPASLVAAAAPRAAAQEAPAVVTEAAPTKGRWDREVFIVTRGADGKSVCREATAAERQNLLRPDATRPDRVLIYPGASRRAALAKSRGADTMTTESGQRLLASAGLDIVLHGTAQLNSNTAARDAFIVAANHWEAIISNQITVVLDVDFGTTFFGQPWSSPSVLGATGTFEVTRRYSTVRTQLLTAAPQPAEQTLYGAMPPTSVPTELTSGTGSASAARLAAPLARALGLEPNITNPDALGIGDGDAGIGFNSAHTFDFNPNDGIDANKTDFDAVVTHEIGHALGFSSESGIPSSSPTVLDLLRFRPGAVSAGNLATLVTAPRVMRTGGVQVFFNNRTNSFGANESGLSTGGPAGNEGDGEQSSHWKADEQTGLHIGIMDPTIADGDREEITDNDKLAFDTFGYRLDGVMVAPPAPPAPQPPPNDNFANAITLNGAAGSVSGDNFDSTGQTGEPNHAGVTATGRRSVWYFWTAPASGQATFDTAGADYDTVLGIYTGGAVNALSLIGSNDDVQNGTVRHSRVIFNATAGTTYRIAVDGFESDTGTFSLNWTAPGPPPPAVNISFAAGTASVNERDATFGALVVRTGELNRTDQVTVQSMDGTANSGPDFQGNTISLTFAPGVDRLVAPFNIVNDAVAEGAEAFSVNLISTSSGALLGPTTTMSVNIADDDSFPANTVAFDGAATRTVVESATRLGQLLGTKVDLTVTRAGNTTQAASVDYRTANGTAVSTKDYTFAGGTLRFAAGETSKTFSVLITEDFHDDENETFVVQLSNAAGASIGGNSTITVTITDNDPPGLTANANDETPKFVDQNYNDFFSRHADQGGLDFWSQGITSCGADAECVRVKRIDTSAAFFLAIEFQEGGYFAYRMYKAAYGNIPGKPVPVRFDEFMIASAEIGRDVQVGVGDWFGKLEANKAAYQLAFVQTGRFRTALPEALTPTQFVNQLNANTGNLLTATEVQNLVISLTNSGNNAQARANVLRAVADNAAFRNAETSRAFVLMQYFGYLRRNPDDVGFDGNPDPQFLGYNFWLTKLNDAGGDFRRAEMVKSFLESIEFRQRFGQ